MTDKRRYSPIDRLIMRAQHGLDTSIGASVATRENPGKPQPDVEMDPVARQHAAGLHMLTEPKRADQLRAPLLEEIHAANITEVLSSNIGCRLHIVNGLKIPVRHPIDFLADYLV